jgi:hypothetical protein
MRVGASISLHAAAGAHAQGAGRTLRDNAMDEAAALRAEACRLQRLVDLVPLDQARKLQLRAQRLSGLADRIDGGHSTMTAKRTPL